ncbi:unnamed protein product [Dovyalis caffra]|uniref:Pentatricopeptide repeat-containing protein n=1 Tax=Dovyalis caffra TaxID=77055 RepID=A0AAV1SC96_9ROSI|nr:unnamed protein product [Dovyalis caffra]
MRFKDEHAILSPSAQMESLGVAPNNTSLPLIFKACTTLNAVEKGKKKHSKVNQVFDKITHRDLISCDAILSGFVGCGFYEETIGLFRKMKNEGFEPNSRTLVALLLLCEGVLELRFGKEIHGYCLRNGYFTTTWPFASVNGPNFNLVGFEKLLASLSGPEANMKGSFKLLKADVSAQAFVKIGGYS